MNHFQMQLKMQYEVRVVEMLLLDFPVSVVVGTAEEPGLIQLYSRYMEETWMRKQSTYETARFILNENYHLLAGYQAQLA